MADVRVRLPLGALALRRMGKFGNSAGFGNRRSLVQIQLRRLTLRWGLCWYGQAPVKRTDTGSIPVTAARNGRASQLAMAAVSKTVER